MPAITPAPTTITAFIGSSDDGGALYEAQEITAAIDGSGPLAQATQRFFIGGATSAWIVRVPPGTPDLTHAFAALDSVSKINLLAMPDLALLGGDSYLAAIAAITIYCERRRAFFIVDPPAEWTDVNAVVNGQSSVAPVVQENGAVYWPLIRDGVTTIPVSGAVAAVYIDTDNTIGVWKAPAGTSAVLPGVEPVHKLTSDETGMINPLGINAIRAFAVYGTVVWGARTLDGADALASDWKYASVRRLALFIESSIVDSLAWTVYEPNDERMWTSIRSSVTDFLNGLWREGAFAGDTAKDAFFVQCDASTTTPTDIDAGIVNVMVGFAPMIPVEFIVLEITAQAAK